MDNCFEYTKKYGQTKFRYARGKSLESGNEIHEYHEILYYIDGDATFLSENHRDVLRKGALLIIPRTYYHRMNILNQDRYQRLVINFPCDAVPCGMERLFDKLSVIHNPNSHIRAIIRRMCALLESDSDTIKPLLLSLYNVLIAEIEYAINDVFELVLPDTDSVLARCIGYVNDCFTQRITADVIAAELDVSVSTLQHRFKSSLGISLHRYITEKRLIYAHGLISGGEMPTKVFYECGFDDYSGFYKAFVRMFGYPPSDIKNLSEV